MKTTHYYILLIITLCLAGFNICSAADITYYPKFRADDSNGQPMAFGQVYSYVPGTTTKKATYTDSTGDVANTNPVVLDNKGEADIYTAGPTKLVLKKKVGSVYVTQWEEVVEGSGVIFGNYKYPDYEATDQGAADATYTTAKDIIDGLAADEEATIFLPHNSGGVTTAYTFLTAETIPSNVTLEFENGAMFELQESATVTLSDGPNQILALDAQHIFNDLNTDYSGVSFYVGGRASIGWFGALDGTNITDPMQSFYDACAYNDGMTMVFPPGDYTLDAWTGGQGGETQKPFRIEKLHMIGYGAKITNTSKDSLPIELFECHDAVVEGFWFDGALETIKPTLLGASPIIINDSRRADIRNCTFINSCSDGITIVGDVVGGSDNSIISGCTINNAARNGISVGSGENITIKNCYITNVGQSTYNRAPYAGIDIEAEESSCRGTRIENCTLINNAYGIRQIDNSFAAGYTTIANCVIQMDLDDFTDSDSNPQDSRCILTDTEDNNLVIDNCFLDGFVLLGGDDFSIRGGEIRATSADNGSPGLRVNASSAGSSSIKGTKFALNPRGASRVFISSINKTGTDLITASLTISDCDFFLDDDAVGGSLNVFSFGSEQSGWVETWTWQNNTFNVSDDVSLEHYIPTPTYHQWGTNAFESELFALAVGEVAATTTSKFAGRLLGPESFLNSYRLQVGLTGASVELDRALRSNSIIVGTSFDIISGGTITFSGGGTQWKVGTTNDDDAFGISSNVNPGNDLGIADWTFYVDEATTPTEGGLNGDIFGTGQIAFPFSTPSTDTDVFIKPDSGTFSGGTVEAIIYFINAR